jgi:RHS repeat-associated protein
LNYDANDRTGTDAYDANGNLLNGSAGSNVYDFENRLVQAGTVKVVYDGDGNRASETVAGVTTKYLVADANLTGYAQVLDELKGGAVSRTYSYGLELINERQTVSGTPMTSFYGFDGHGSVRFLTDTTGAITDTYDYDAFGNLVSQTGTTPNNYLFAAEQFDPVLGVYYNRARYYDQRIGRFWTMDGFEGYADDSRTLHKYLYVGNEPTDRNDRSGRDFSLTGLSINIAISATIDAIAGFKVNGLRGALEGGLKGAVIGAAFFAFGGLLGAAGSKLVAFARASTTAGRIALDTNVLIAALEGGEKAAVDAALAGRAPVISITVAKEFLVKGDINLLRQFLAERGGGLAASATAAEIAQLQAQATLLGRVLAAADAAVSGSAIKEGIPLLTRDIRLINFLQAVGQVVETF